MGGSSGQTVKRKVHAMQALVGAALQTIEEALNLAEVTNGLKFKIDVVAEKDLLILLEQAHAHQWGRSTVNWSAWLACFCGSRLSVLVGLSTQMVPALRDKRLFDARQLVAAAKEIANMDHITGHDMFVGTIPDGSDLVALACWSRVLGLARDLLASAVLEWANHVLGQKNNESLPFVALNDVPTAESLQAVRDVQTRCFLLLFAMQLSFAAIIILHAVR